MHHNGFDLTPAPSSRQKKLIIEILKALFYVIVGYLGGCTGYLKVTRHGETLEVGGTVQQPTQLQQSSPGK